MIRRVALFHSRLARRILAVFLACAIVPVVCLAVLSYVEVSSLVVDRAGVELARVGKGYVSIVHDRLLLAEQELELLVARPGAGPAYPFTAVWVDALAQPAAGVSGPRVLVEPGGQVPQVVLQVPRQGTSGVIAGRLEDRFIWGDADDVPVGMGVCVYDAEGRRVHCTSAPDDVDLARALGMDPTGRGTVVTVGEGAGAVLASRRELFLPHFHLSEWSVVVWRTVASVQAPVQAFRSGFVPAAALAVLMAVLLSLVQIRRTLVPLQALRDGALRSADRDFTTRLPAHGSDEFAQLAGAFNAMNERLGRQFETLRTLADIDRSILGRHELDRIVEAVLVRVVTLLPSQSAAVVIFDREGGSTLRAYAIDAAGAPTPALERLDAPQIDRTAWLANPVIRSWPGDAEHPLPKLLAARGARHVVALPILAARTVAGALVIGFVRSDATLGAEEGARAHDLADRLGVAFATAAKDDELYRQAHYDALTELPNRLLFRTELARRMAQAHRERRSVALLFIDLDNFKKVNDSAGHAVGDELLREAALRLRRCVRACDALARMGGDEFTIIISDLGEARAAEVVAHHVLDALGQPYTVGHAEHFLTASIGIAVHPADGESLEELLRNADTAMYRAKEAGRNRCVYFEERMNQAAVARVSMERQLRRALEANEFQLVYQPQFVLATGGLAAAEALLRWRQPDGTVLLPGSFIAHAEETGIIERIGAWVLEEACRQQRQWLRAGIAPARIAINVSAQQFRHADFPGEVERCLAEAGIPPASLELEITESLLMDPSRNIERALEHLASIGVRIALDDFGTGYSSLAYLKRFPVDVVKIDRAFVADLEGDASSVAICGAIVGMAHALAKEVVAEGVETSAQAAVLRRLGCDFVQGYHYAPPLAPAAYAARLRESRGTPVAAAST